MRLLTRWTLRQTRTRRASKWPCRERRRSRTTSQSSQRRAAGRRPVRGPRAQGRVLRRPRLEIARRANEVRLSSGAANDVSLTIICDSVTVGSTARRATRCASGRGTKRCVPSASRRRTCASWMCRPTQRLGRARQRHAVDDAEGRGYAVTVPPVFGDFSARSTPTPGRARQASSGDREPAFRWRESRAATSSSSPTAISSDILRPRRAPRGEGLATEVVDVEDIFDSSYGAHSPRAVRDFLAWRLVVLGARAALRAARR